MVKRLIIFIFWIHWHCQNVQTSKCESAISLLNDLDTLRHSKELNSAERIRALPDYENRLQSCLGHFDSTHRKIFRAIGDLYYEGSAYSKAISFYEKSIAVTELHLKDPAVKPTTLISDYYKLFLANDAVNNITEKMNALDSSAMVAIRLKSVDIYCLYALYKRAEYSFHIGDYHRCIDVAELCESLAMEYLKKDSSDALDYATSSIEWQMNAKLVLGKPEEAKALLQDRVSRLDSLQLTNSLGNTYGFLADVYWYRNNPDSAIPLYQKSIQYFEKSMSLEKDSSIAFNYKSSLNLLGYQIYFKYLNNRKAALQYLKRALNFPVTDKRVKLENTLESLSILNRIGNIYAAKGEYDTAMYYFQKAFDQIKPGINENDLVQPTLDDFAENKRQNFIATLIFDKGQALLQRYRSTHDSNSIKHAVGVFKVGDRFLEKIKTEQSDFKSKLFWRNDRRKLYESAIDACYLAGNVEDAFYFFEKSRAVLLLDQLKEQRILRKEELIRQALLKTQVAKLEGESHSATEEEKLQIQQQLIQAQKELDKINNVFAKRNPLYSEGYFDVSKDLLKSTQANLSKQKASLLEFFDGDSIVYCIRVDSNKMIFTRIDRSKFDTAVVRFLRYLSDRVLLNQDFEGFLTNSNSLYGMIFGTDSLMPGKIIVSPDGRYFPFEALITNTSNEKPSYLLESNPISYIHSAKFLAASMHHFDHVETKDFLGVAPVEFNPALDRISLTGSDQSLNDLTSTIGSAKNLTFKRASKPNFLREFGDYQIIQLYTHASGGTGDDEPQIYFSDSILLLSELTTNKKTQTRLIVLSACETGKGKWYGGEGVFSFNRGFAALGVPTTVTNLWSVENKSTYRLTKLFYKYLRAGENLDVALQKAKLEFLSNGAREERLPYYWAAAILTGSVEPIELSKPRYLEGYFNWFGLIVFLTMLFAFWLNYKGIKMAIPDRSSRSLRIS